jgi:hypothetical protein
MQAGGVPIAVPVSCSQKVFPNLNRLLRIKISKLRMMALMLVMPLQLE